MKKVVKSLIETEKGEKRIEVRDLPVISWVTFFWN